MEATINSKSDLPLLVWHDTLFHLLTKNKALLLHPPSNQVNLNMTTLNKKLLASINAEQKKIQDDFNERVTSFNPKKYHSSVLEASL